MQVRRRVLMAGATFLLAAATGHVMQSGDAISARLRSVSQVDEVMRPVPGATAVTPLQASLMRQSGPDDVIIAAEIAVAGAGPAPQPLPVRADLPALPDLPAAGPTPFTAGVLLSGRLDGLDTYQRPASAADARYDAFGIPCAAPVLTLAATEAALLAVTIAASCHPDERMTIHHAGLIFTMQTDTAGQVWVLLPALTRDAEVSIGFNDGDKARAVQTVEGLAAMSRVAVQWRGRPGFRLNVYEDGAAFGQAGHVTASDPRDPATTEGGFLMLLGDPAVEAPMLAEVYTLPEGPPARPVKAELTIEAEVTGSACGRILHGEALYARAGAEPRRDPLRLAMPGCDAMGDFVMLALPDLPRPASVVVAGR